MRTLKISLLIFILPITLFAQWYQQNSGTTDPLAHVQFVNEQVGWTTTDQEIYKTTDGGANWQLQYTHYPIFQVLFNNEDVGWLLSWWNYDPELLKTVDGGETWVQVYLGGEWIYELEFINPDTGWIVGAVEFGYLFKATTDGGTTWVDKTVSPNYYDELRDIEVIDNLNLIVSGYETLFKTTNGGNTWQEIPIFWSDQYALQIFNMNLGWAREPYGYGGTLFKTTDGGYTWIQQVQPFDNYQFITPQIGWYTNENEIYYSTDGGYSWTLQNSGTNSSLYDIFFLDNNNGWAVGENGTILHTINGGIPVELISFTAEVNESEETVELHWSTATETNNSGFEILRSPQNDSEVWNKIGFVPGHGTTTEPKSYSFTNENVNTGIYKYRLKQIDFDGSFTYSDEIEVEADFSPKEFVLYQNYPNPFNPSTKIKYTIPASPKSSPKERTFVQLIVYDLLGRDVAVLVNEEMQHGAYETVFDGSNLSSGVYFYRLTAGEFSETKKLVLLK
jgi:photosystem II stability/assembly factor-like uncharacterized protein